MPGYETGKLYVHLMKGYHDLRIFRCSTDGWTDGWMLFSHYMFLDILSVNINQNVLVDNALSFFCFEQTLKGQ